MTYECILNEQQIKNLNVFLDRTSLSGSEAMAFLELKRIFNLSMLENKKKSTKNEKV